eukprot:UN30782
MSRQEHTTTTQTPTGTRVVRKAAPKQNKQTQIVDRTHYRGLSCRQLSQTLMNNKVNRDNENGSHYGKVGSNIRTIRNKYSTNSPRTTATINVSSSPRNVPNVEVNNNNNSPHSPKHSPRNRHMTQGHHARSISNSQYKRRFPTAHARSYSTRQRVNTKNSSTPGGSTTGTGSVITNHTNSSYSSSFHHPPHQKN